MKVNRRYKQGAVGTEIETP